MFIACDYGDIKSKHCIFVSLLKAQTRNHRRQLNCIYIPIMNKKRASRHPFLSYPATPRIGDGRAVNLAIVQCTLMFFQRSAQSRKQPVFACYLTGKDPGNQCDQRQKNMMDESKLHHFQSPLAMACFFLLCFLLFCGLHFSKVVSLHFDAGCVFVSPGFPFFFGRPRDSATRAGGSAIMIWTWKYGKINTLTAYRIRQLVWFWKPKHRLWPRHHGVFHCNMFRQLLVRTN